MNPLEDKRRSDRIAEITQALREELAKPSTSPAQWELVAIQDLLGMVPQVFVDDSNVLRETSPAVYQPAVPGMNFRELQTEVDEWSTRNFGYQPADNPFLGVVEELGELAHAMLKSKQGIRGTREEHHAAAKDAVADLVIFLADYCSKMGFDLQEVVESTWAKVKLRDWTKDKLNGGEEAAETASDFPVPWPWKPA